MLVIKRNNNKVTFEKEKIEIAIKKSMDEVTETCNYKLAEKIANDIEERLLNTNIEEISIYDIEDMVEEKLMASNHKSVARQYIQYRYVRKLARDFNKRDENILKLIQGVNEEAKTENSNKNTALSSTQRDYIASEVCKDLAQRILIPKEIVDAHNEGVLHFHDMDYSPAQNMINCCLVNIKDILDNGTCINGTTVESPHTFSTACTITTQVISCVSNGQFGGQTVNVKHLGKYLKRSYDKYFNKYSRLFDKYIGETMAKELMQEDLTRGVQTVQYQINTISSSNGQSPFVTLFLELDEHDEYLNYTAMIIEEILKQRIQGVKNEVGVWITPVFPKLVYLLDECNNLSGGKYDYLTHLASECTSKRAYPDYISAKKMRKYYEGNIVPSMGCRSFLSPWKDSEGNYKFEGRFNMGVVTLNLPQVALEADDLTCEIEMLGQDCYQEEILEHFKDLLKERLELCFQALMFRYKSLLGTKSTTSPIHWQYGAIARLGKDEVIDSLLKDNYATISLGYIGLYEVTKMITGEPQTGAKGKEFALWLMNYLRETTDKWKKETGLGFALYGTPSESLCYRFAKIDKAKYGSIKDITDKNYYTNSYHVDVREEINAFSKLSFESEFQKISSGGSISYIEIPNLQKNIKAIEDVIKYIYNNVLYGEFNTKTDCCHKCLYDGEMLLNDNNKWYCPNCNNTDTEMMNIVRRTCGYLGSNLWNDGKTQEIKNRVLHLGQD